MLHTMHKVKYVWQIVEGVWSLIRSPLFRSYITKKLISVHPTIVNRPGASMLAEFGVTEDGAADVPFMGFEGRLLAPEGAGEAVPEGAAVVCPRIVEPNCISKGDAVSVATTTPVESEALHIASPPERVHSIPFVNMGFAYVKLTSLAPSTRVASQKNPGKFAAPVYLLFYFYTCSLEPNVLQSTTRCARMDDPCCSTFGIDTSNIGTDWLRI